MEVGCEQRCHASQGGDMIVGGIVEGQFRSVVLFQASKSYRNILRLIDIDSTQIRNLRADPPEQKSTLNRSLDRATSFVIMPAPVTVPCQVSQRNG